MQMRTLGELIHQHVDNYYQLWPINVSVWTLSESLLVLGFMESGSGLRAEDVAALCLEPRSRKIGLRHVISYVVILSIDVHSRSRLSMLPRPVAAFLRSLPAAEAHGKLPRRP